MSRTWTGAAAPWPSAAVHGLLLLLSLASTLLGTVFGEGEFKIPDAAVEADKNHWYQLGASGIDERLRHQVKIGRAKNVVLFLGDGMGIPTVTAARIYKGQRLSNRSGEESVLSWDTFPHLSLSRTYGLDVQTSDSANTATAYLCGVKANFETLGVDSRIKSGQCHSDTSTHLPSIMQWAQDAGLWTGIVTTTRVTHATPAASYSHSGHRNWEAEVPPDCDAKDIAYQLVHSSPGKGYKVILGGGRRVFLDKNMKDEEGKPGQRTDGKNLIKEWTDARKNEGNATYVWTKQGLLSVNPQKTDYLLGLFDNSHVPYVIERSDANTTKPTLPEMTKVALDLLSRAPNGFVLLVEGGRIDQAHHLSMGGSALEETLEFDQAVSDTYKLLDPEESLIVVTADHSHTFTMGGYPQRGTNVLGIAGYSDVDQLPFTVLTYGNGPGFSTDKTNFTNADVAKPDYIQRSAFKLTEETHGGEEVAVYATGPWAHLFSGSHDQSYIPHVLAYASCVGRFAGEKCASPGGGAATPSSLGVVSALMMATMAAVGLR
uniref:alkaline phosphatase n=1 Tax=Ixodes ricinus TaxID=34613 RepID=V5H3K2_IXORI